MNEAFPSLLGEHGEYSELCPEDGAPAHYSRAQFLQCGPSGVATTTPCHTDLDLWDHLRAKVYTVEERSMEHLQERSATACAEIIPHNSLLEETFSGLRRRHGGHVVTAYFVNTCAQTPILYMVPDILYIPSPSNKVL
jgi:hypothetical protein